ncbi:hypothetical protein SDC9_103676 [bioreactor metagenome]|uniref:Uncharacterized protein n=1 Tax=bioreactor metagenome TaxID=1076179 RepID=A0A645AUQ7_9ZZZZ
MDVIGQNARGVIVHVLEAIRPRPQRRGLIHDRRRHIDISPRVSNSLNLHRNESSVPFRAQLNLKINRVALIALADGLLAGERILRGSAGLECNQPRANGKRFGGFDLSAERSANHGGFYDHLRNGDVQHACHAQAQVVGRL